MAKEEKTPLEACMKVVEKDDKLFTKILAAWDDSEGDTLSGLIDGKVRKRVNNI